MSVLCFGEALIDFLSDGQTPERFTKYAGGAPANVAVALAKVGVESGFAGMLGDDQFGHFLHQELTEHGVNTMACQFTSQANTALAFVHLDQQGERSFTFYRPPAADLLFKASDFDKVDFQQYRCFHICSNSLTEKAIYQTTVSGIERAKAHGLFTSFDVNLRENLWQNISKAAERCWHIIALSDIVKVTKEELAFLNAAQTNKSTEQTIDAIINTGVKLLVITDGGEPVQYISGKFSGTLSAPKVKAIDTTAAGDAFIAGLLSQIVAQCESKDALKTLAEDEAKVVECLNFAVHSGAFTVTKKGAFSALPRHQDVLALMAQASA